MGVCVCVCERSALLPPKNAWRGRGVWEERKKRGSVLPAVRHTKTGSTSFAAHLSVSCMNIYAHFELFLVLL